ncbi:MAG: S8 family peptidase [Gaiellaceae bacterium]|jgi:subtilisin family serine protease
MAGAPPAGATLVQVGTNGGPLARAAGGTVVSGDLGIWNVPERAVASLRRAHVVVRTEPNRLLVPAATALEEPLAANEWWRSAIGADAVPAPGPGKPVTIVDSGIDLSHEEFAARPNTAALNDQTTTLEDDDHGTEVASVIGAPINGRGLAGVYPQVVLRSWDASPFGFITTASAVRGITEAARRGAGVINLSFGGEDPDPLLEEAILYAFRRGSLVVVSAGNEGLEGNPLSYPAAYPHVLTVAATDESNVVAVFSSQSPFVDLAAPGRRIPVAEPVADDPSGYILASGTSFSSPMVAAAAAWVWTARPELDNTQLFDVMRFSSRDVDAPGYDSATGFGLLNIPSALSFAVPARDPQEPNDDVEQVSPRGLFAGGQPAIVTPTRRTAAFAARLDRREDPRDLYRAYVPPHGSLTARTSGGPVNLRVLPAGARSTDAAPLGASARRGTQPDTVTIRSRSARGVYVYVDVRLEGTPARSGYALRVTAAARR